jgi:hypothetical protein
MKLYDVIKKENSKIEEPEKEHVFIPTENPVKKRRYIFIILLTLFCLVIIYIAGIYISRAKVIINEREIPFSLEKATIDLPHETKTDKERLSFQTMTVSTEIRREIFGSELKEVTGKAKGNVVFFNEYSKTSQTIKSGTKLIGNNGKTYQTQQTVTIPGYTLDSKKKKVTGASSSVSIIAVEVGPNSNSEGLSFTISGYSGAKKSQIYARSAGPLTGGESGMRHTVSEAERPALLESLKTQLTERLKRETRAQIPPELITYPDLQFVSIDTDSLKLEGEGVKFTAQIKGTMVSYLMSRSLFESAIAKDVLSDHSYANVTIPSISSLNVIPKSPIPANPQTLPESISIEISGSGSIITKAPVQRIKESLLGVKRGSFDSIIGTFPEISSSSFRVTPFWAPFFPKKESYIKVDIK